MEGYIKTHRQMVEWEWYTDGNTFRLFFHLLLKANHKDGSWRGQKVTRGQLITGRFRLADELGLTEQQIRTSLNKLKSTNEITIKTTNKNSLIEITNYNKYQDNNQQDNQQITNKQPTNNQQITTNKNDNNNKNEKNIIDKSIIKSESFGNEDINNMQEVIKSEVGKLQLIYKSGKQERNRIRNILTGKEFGDTCRNANMTREQFVIEIIKLSGKLEFWKGKIYNATTFYEHYPKVYNEARRIKTEVENRPKIRSY